MKLIQQVFLAILSVCGQVQLDFYIPASPYGGISSVFLPSTNSFYFHSGLESDREYLRGIQSIYFDSESNIWRYKVPLNIFYPDSRSFYGAFLYNGNYYMFGGIGLNAIYKDFWYYNIENDYWINMQISNPISSRYSFAHSFFTFKSRPYFAVIGGKSNSYYDNLIDFYIFDVESQVWINQTGYGDCFNKGLSGAMLEYNDEALYLFAGKNLNRSEITFLNDVCRYSLNSDLSPSLWEPLKIDVPLFNTTRGGSCSHDGFLYSFFGLDTVEGMPTDLDKIARLNLSYVESGWVEVGITGCSMLGERIARDSFGFFYDSGLVFINGGFHRDQILSSIFVLDLNNSEPNVQCTVLSLDISWPSRRNGASLVYVSGSLYMFGGMDQGTPLNDLYVFNLTSFEWSLVVTYGNIPSARYRHSASSEGKYMVIVGGIGLNNVILKDYYLYESETFTWTLIQAKSGSKTPPPVYSNCIAIKFPKIYAVGGFEDSHITNSLWEFDLSTLTFSKLYDYNPDIDTGMFSHGCSVETDKEGKTVVTTYFGAQSIIDVPFCAITRYDLSQSNIKPQVTPFTNSKFPCRCHNAYHLLNDNYLLVAGGERYQQEFFNDVWIINRVTQEVYQLNSMKYAIYYAANSFFNNTLFIFSGYSSNGLALNAPSSDYSVEINLVNLNIPGLALACGYGMELINSWCEFCPVGFYNPYSNSSVCLKCPAGSYNPNTGSSSIYQCVPCPYNTYSTEGSSSCEPCEEDSKCYIGTSSNSLSESQLDYLEKFREHKDQPELYEPTEIIQIKFILWMTVLGIIILFSIIYCLDYRIRIFFSYYDVYKNAHIEMICNKDGELIEKPLTIVPSKVGGYFSFITALILIALAVDTAYTYVKTNIEEDIVLVPIDSLIEKEDFDDNSLEATLMFSTYRGKCSFDFLNFTYSSHVKLNSKELEKDGPFCKFHFDLKLTDIVETDDFLRFYFYNDPLAYTSDINIRLKTHSSIPDQDSIVTQYIKTDNERVFRGTEDSNFYFSFLPSYYKEITTFEEFSKLGYVLSINQSPTSGTQVDPREIGIYSGVGIKVNLMRIEIGITTYKSPKVELMEFLLKFMEDFPGTIVMIGFFLWFYELFYNLAKGRTSGRNILIKRDIERERARRNGRSDSFIEGGINE